MCTWLWVVLLAAPVSAAPLSLEPRTAINYRICHLQVARDYVDGAQACFFGDPYYWDDDVFSTVLELDSCLKGVVANAVADAGRCSDLFLEEVVDADAKDIYVLFRKGP